MQKKRSKSAANASSDSSSDESNNEDYSVSPDRDTQEQVQAAQTFQNGHIDRSNVLLMRSRRPVY